MLVAPFLLIQPSRRSVVAKNSIGENQKAVLRQRNSTATKYTHAIAVPLLPYPVEVTLDIPMALGIRICASSSSVLSRARAHSLR